MIIFSNGHRIIFEDIIVLTSEQRFELLSYAELYSQVEIKGFKTGLKVELTVSQKNNILTTKDEILQEKDPKEIFKEKLVKFTVHSVERMIQRYQGDLTNIYFSIIEMIQQSDEISNLAEWKGYKSLTYTFLHSNNNILNRVAAVFIKNNHRLQVITAMNDQVTNDMDFRISEDSKLADDLLKLRNKLKNRYKK